MNIRPGKLPLWAHPSRSGRQVLRPGPARPPPPMRPAIPAFCCFGTDLLLFFRERDPRPSDEGPPQDCRSGRHAAVPFRLSPIPTRVAMSVAEGGLTVLEAAERSTILAQAESGVTVAVEPIASAFAIRAFDGRFRG